MKKILLSLAQTICRAGGVFVGLSEDDLLVFFNDRDLRYRSTMCLPTPRITVRCVRLKILSKRREYERTSSAPRQEV